MKRNECASSSTNIFVKSAVDCWMLCCMGSGHVQWCTVTSRGMHPSCLSKSVLTKTFVKKLRVEWSKIRNYMLQQMVSQHSSSFPIKLIIVFDSKWLQTPQTFWDCRGLETSRVVSSSICFDNAGQCNTGLKHTHTEMIGNSKNTAVEYLQNSTEWPSTESCMQVFAKVV